MSYFLYSSNINKYQDSWNSLNTDNKKEQSKSSNLLKVLASLLFLVVLANQQCPKGREQWRERKLLHHIHGNIPLSVTTKNIHGGGLQKSEKN
jgi:hypothetical protein